MTDQGIELAVSTVIFALRPHPSTGDTTLWLPLVRRIRQPHEGRWALPGGPLLPDEDLAASARHTLERTTGLTSSYLEQLYSFGAMERSPQRVVSIVYWALVRSDEVARAVDGENVAVVRRRRDPRARVRPQRDRAVRAQPAAGQDHLLPHRPVLPAPRSSPWPSCARCTRRCCASGSTPRTSGARPWPPRPSSPPATSSPAPATDPHPPSTAFQVTPTDRNPR